MKENPFSLVNPDQLSFLEVAPDEYVQAMAHDVVRFYDDMGLDPNFMPIVARHLGDMHLQWDVLGNSPTTLGVSSALQDGNTRKWYRTATINQSHFAHYRDVVHDTLESRELIDGKDEEQIVEKLALNWMFYGLTADVVANSYSMQQRYDAYIPDWNGQAAIYLAQYAMSEAFYREYAPGTEHDARIMSLDHENFRAGVSLLQLKDDLLRMGVVKHDTVAGWVIHDLGKKLSTA